MEVPKDDSFMEIMALLRRRNRLCTEWMHMLDKDLEEKAITFDEYMKQAQRIKEEMAKTDEAIKRQEEYLKNVRTIRK